MKLISARKAKEKLDNDHNKNKNVVLLDIRTSIEYNEFHAKGAINLPLDKLDELKFQIKNSKKEILIICKSGQRSQIACKKLNSIENNHIYSVEGGTLAWLQNNFDIINAKIRKNSWDIERQVRLIAGILVFIGVFLGYLITSYFYILSALVALGLIFAAITNTCTMGLLLMKLPYNQTKSFSLEKIKTILNY